MFIVFYVYDILHITDYGISIAFFKNKLYNLNLYVMKKTVIIILSILLTVNLFAQKGTNNDNILNIAGKIIGQIVENNSKKAMEYANVAVYALPDSNLITGAITNAEGKFEISNLKKGKYYIVADFIGYDKRIVGNIEISAKNRVKNCGTIYLKESSIGLDEITVTAEKNVVQYKVDKKVVNVSKKLTAQGGTVANALENTPSIQVDAEGNVMLRGSSSYTVLIDGKPTALTGSDALKQIPASAVENVEIITNPSVKYDPDGTSGIINIIMKKNIKSGVNGMINASIGTQLKRSADFNLNYRSGKVNYYIGGNYAERPMYPQTEFLSTTKLENENRYVHQLTDRTQINSSRSVKGGLDFYLNDNNTLSFTAEYGYAGFYLEMDNKVHEYTNPISTDIYYLNNGGIDLGGNYTNANINFDHKFKQKGHQLVASVIYSKWDALVESNTKAQETNSDWSEILNTDKFRTLKTDDEDRVRFKLDYTLPINEKTKLEAGYQGRYKYVDSDYKLQNYETNWIDNPDYDNGMEYLRNLQSFYTTFSGSALGLNIQLGLRAEYTDRLLKSKKEKSEYPYNNLDLFPSVHISKQLKSGTQVQASYSRRTNRPSEWNLNPFPIYSDNYMSQSGNPNLLPEFTDSYELNIMQRMKIGFVALEGYYRQTNNAFEQTLNLQDDNTVKIEMANLGKNYSYGAELSSNLSLAKWINLYASANVYSLNVSGDIVSEDAETQSINSDFVLNANLVRKTTRLQITGFYNAPRVTAQGMRAEMYGMNLALSQEFLKRKLILTLRANNVLNTMKFQFTANTPELTNDLKFTMEYPVVMFSLSYRINNYKQRKQDDGMENNFGNGIM